MRRFFAGFASLALLGVASVSLAGVDPLYDHLECFKMRDSIGYGAVVDLEPQFNNPGIPLQVGCRVATKGKEICFPVAKTVTSSEEPTIPANGQNLNNGFICYTVKCPFDGVADFSAGDQFGVRNVGRLKVYKLCAPADW